VCRCNRLIICTLLQPVHCECSSGQELHVEWLAHQVLLDC
jgi:hypothetical protein